MTETERIIKKGKLQLRGNGFKMRKELSWSELYYIKANVAEFKSALAGTNPAEGETNDN